MILFTGGAIPACIAGGILACLAAGLRGGGWYSSMPCRFPGPHPRGKFRGIWSRPTAKGEVEGDLARGCLLWGGGCLFQGVCSRGECVGPSPPVTATAAGGMHPTAMHSCFVFLSSDVLSNSLFKLCNNFTGHTLLSSTMPELDLIAMEKEILKW